MNHILSKTSHRKLLAAIIIIKAENLHGSDLEKVSRSKRFLKEKEKVAYKKREKPSPACGRVHMSFQFKTIVVHMRYINASSFML